MWLVSTLLADHWFDSFSEALACFEQAPKTRTYPRLEARAANAPAQPFEYVYR